MIITKSSNKQTLETIVKV